MEKKKKKTFEKAHGLKDIEMLKYQNVYQKDQLEVSSLRLYIENKYD